METQINLMLSEREGKYDVRVVGGTESDWERLETLLEKMQAEDLVLYCGRQRIANGACRFIMTRRMESDPQVSALRGERRRLAIQRWLTHKVNQ